MKQSINYELIFGATNSKVMPSDSMPTRNNAEKSFAIAAFSQEMALAGLMRANSLGLNIDNILINNAENALFGIYKASGFESPEAALNSAKSLLNQRLQSPQEISTRISR